MAETAQVNVPKQAAGTSPTTDSQLLTTRLRLANKKQHKISDGLVAAKMAVVCTDGKLYARSLACFWAIHSALEDAVAKLAHLPEVKPLAELLPRLARKQRFEDDLKFWIGKDWRAMIGAHSSSVVAAYVDRIDKLTHEKDGVAILAHFYTQQAAILFGGKRVRQIVRGTLPLLPDDPATRAFEHEEDAKVLREALQSAVNGLSGTLGEAGIQKVITERNLVFTLNNEIISSFNINKWNWTRAVIRLVPMEILLCAIFIPICFFALYISHRFILTPEVLEENRRYTAELEAAAQASGQFD